MMSSKRSEFLAYFFRIIFRRKLLKLVWKSPRGKLKIRNLAENLENPENFSQGSIFLNILDLWKFGVLDGQIVRVTVTATTVLGDVQQFERLLMVKSCRKTAAGNFEISKIDFFNIFGTTVVQQVTVDNIIPHFILRREKLEILENLKFARIRDFESANNKIRLNPEKNRKFFEVSQNFLQK
ncbi:unnamed protein product [Caenorhabditis angaria]|uniref:Uncharacterized protein n=1 Tax=Caenorhabditis angaria TaxID=860376 RepID=A0A9P1IQE6_9PELO|nr:unnamed protein product [Caenorhabditis angaria]